MSKLQIGQLQPSLTPGLRDAFHVPCVLVETDQHLAPGQWVRFTDDKFDRVYGVNPNGGGHGIVDPFVDSIKPGDNVFVLLKPGTISERLTHHFDLNIKDVMRSLTTSVQDDYEDQCKGCW